MMRALLRRAGHEHGLLTVATLVIPALVFAGAAWLAWRNAYDDARARLGRTLDIAHENVARTAETFDLLLREANSTLSALTDAEIRARAPDLARHWTRLVIDLPQVENLHVAASDGEILVSALDAPTMAAPAPSLKLAPPLDPTAATMSASPLLPSPGAASGLFYVARTRHARDGAAAGTIYIAAQPAKFTGYWRRNGIADDTPSGMTVVLFRADGAFLVRWPQPLRPGQAARASDDFLHRIAASPEAGSYEVRSSNDDIHRLIAYRRVQGQPFYVVASLRFAAIVAAWRDAVARQFAIGLPATIALFLLARLGAARSRRETEALALLRAEVARRESAEAALLQAQKMEAIGHLSGGIAHDFNNLLTAISGSIDMLARDPAALDDRARRYAALGRDAAQRAATLTHRLLAFARQQPLEPRILDLSALVDGMADLLRRTLGEDIEIRLARPDALWLTRADPHQVENALLNLAVNARDAMPDGGRLTIETANLHLDAAQAMADADATPGDYVTLSVTDSGTGMPPEILARAFDPFFTTKPQGKGTGLGLSMIYGFARQSGGHVRIRSRPGQGTTVTLCLPRAAAASADDRTPPDPAMPLPEGRGETILLVEDDDAVREFSTDTLRGLGYDILAAREAAGALALLREHPAIALLFTDVVLPGPLNGRRLAEEARRLRPGLPVLFTTGHTSDAVLNNGALGADMALIAKPFTARALAARLRAALDQAQPARTRDTMA